jgi:Polysaccharide deacetylase
MRRVPPGATVDERGGRIRGVVEFAAGHYPSFLFGLPVGDRLPVFHFHETTREQLEPALRYLVENGYRTIGSSELARFVREGRHPGPRSVMLTFDDAWASLWLVVGPLLHAFNLRAVTYAIPGRLRDADSVRPTMATGPVDAAAADRDAYPFVTWPELRALSDSGRIEVQSHTWSHAMVFTGDRAVGLVDPDFAREPHLNRPRLTAADPPEFLTPDRLGFPIFPCRSRLSSGRRFYPDAAACARIETFVADHGGPALFARGDWRGSLGPLLADIAGRWEDAAERSAAIEHELAAARDTLEARLAVRVGHVCLPWGVTSQTTGAALARLGFSTAFANRWSGRLAVAHGDHPYALKRLHHRYIFALPGRGRRSFLALA